MTFDEIQKKFGTNKPRGKKKSWEQILKEASQTPAEAKKPTHHEDKLQIQCVKWFELQHSFLAPLLHHSPNGGARSKAEGAIFKKMGTRAGFPDLFLYLPRFNVMESIHYHGLAIEMKTTEKGSKQSDAQKEWEKRLTEQGYKYKVCRTFEEFQKIIHDYIYLR